MWSRINGRRAAEVNRRRSIMARIDVGRRCGQRRPLRTTSV